MVKPRFDIPHYNWVKAAWVASLRAIFGSGYVPPEYKFVDDEEETKILIYTAFPYRSFRTPLIVVNADHSNASVSYTGPQEQVRRVELNEFRSRMVKSDSNTDTVLLDGDPVLYSNLDSIDIPGVDPSKYTIEEGPDGYAQIRWSDSPFEPEVPFEISLVLKNPIPFLYFTGILRLSIRISIYASTVTDVEKLTDLVTVFLRFFLRDRLAELKITYTKIDVSGINTVEWNGELLYSVTITVGNCHTEYDLLFPEELLGYINQVNIEGIIQQILAEEVETRQSTVVK